MTEEQKYDRWERFAKLLYKECLRASRESRKQTEKLKALVEAKRKYEAAELALQGDPNILRRMKLYDSQGSSQPRTRRSQTLKRK